MSGIALLGMVGMLVLPLLAIVALLVFATVSGSERTGLHRGALLARWIGLAAAVVLSLAILAISIQGTWPGGRLGVGALTGTALLIGATVLVIAILVGELTLPARSASQQQHASRDRCLYASEPGWGIASIMHAFSNANAKVSMVIHIDSKKETPPSATPKL